MTPGRVVTSVLALCLFALIAPLGGCNGQLRFGDVPDDGGVPDASLPPPPDASATDGTPDVGAPDATTPGRPDASAVDGGAADTSLPTPTGCVTDGDCKLSTLHCDAVSGACVACVVDAHCTTAGAKRCDAALHRCVECGVDGDCGSSQRCEPSTRRCINTCQSITGCPAATPFCDLSRSTCARCHTEVECIVPGDAHNCDPANGYCVDCVTDSQCKASTPRCDRTRGACVQCTTSSDCPAATPICDPLSFGCVTG